MKDTCRKAECYWWGLTDGKCPNYVESWWTPKQTDPGPPVQVSDCAPIRTFLMVQELHNALVGIQKAQEEIRNENVWVQAVANLIGKTAGIDIEVFAKERERIVQRNQVRLS